MFEYSIIFLVLFAVSILFYLLYERFFKHEVRSESVLYVEALKDLLANRQEAAFAKLRQVVAVDTGNIDAYLRLGQILRDNKKPDRALQVHKDLTLRTGLPRAVKIEILRQLHLDYCDLQDFDMAQSALEELITLQSDDCWAHQRLLELFEKQQKWVEAYDTAAQVLKLESNKSKKPLAVYKFHQGEDHLKKREHHKARVLFKEALGLDPGLVPAYLAIGDSYYEEDRAEDALIMWNKLIEIVPEEGHRAIERMKKTLFDLGRFGDIVDICRRIMEHSPRNFEARHTLAEFHEKKGDLESAISILTEALDDSPTNIKTRLELIRIYLQKGDSAKIVQLLKDLERSTVSTAASLPDKMADKNLVESGR